MDIQILSIQLSGDWERLINFLRALEQNLPPTFRAQIYEDGEMVLEKLRGHIEAQDLGWAPLSSRTVELKNGDDTIYVETGTLLGSLEAHRMTGSGWNGSVTVGATPGTSHGPSGRTMGEIMGWMEYGTSRQPPRPLFRPTFDEVRDILRDNWRQLFIDEIHRYAG